MVKMELIKRSPLRVFEKSIHGGVGKGNIGVLASRKGVGKTACLVHIATDQLLRGKHVIHVSFATRVDHIITWYEDIFKEIAKKRNLEEAIEVHDEIIRNRVIMNFSQEGVATGQILHSISAMIREGGFAADTIIFDGYDLARSTPEEFGKFRRLAAELGLEAWFSVSLGEGEVKLDETGIPTVLKPYLDDIGVLITLALSASHVQFVVVKDHDLYDLKDMHLKLDPKTLLIVEEA